LETDYLDIFHKVALLLSVSNIIINNSEIQRLNVVNLKSIGCDVLSAYCYGVSFIL